MRMAWLVVLMACGDDGAMPIDGAPIDHPVAALGGQLLVIQGHSPQGDSTVIGAFFGVNALNTMVTREDGPCRIERATPFDPQFHGAGQMRISANGGSSIVMFPAGTTYQDAVTQYRYLGGETLLVEAMGAVVPAFSQSIGFPHPVTGLQPPTQILKSSDLTTTWTPTESDVFIQFAQGPDTSLLVGCTFPGASGTGTIPASAFAELVTSELAGMQISTHVEANGAAGAYDLRFRTDFFADQGTGKIPVRD